MKVVNPALRLGIDATYALDPHPTGVARYSQRLIAALAARPDLCITLAARPHRYRALRGAYSASRFSRTLLQEPLNLLLPHTDLFHALNQRLPHYDFRRAVTTIHDVFAITSDRYSTPDFQRKFGEMIRDAVRRSDALIAVSAYTRDELCRVTDCDPAKVTVVHHGIDAPVAMARSGGTQGTYFLTVGVVQTRKNTLAAVRAVESLAKSVKLVVAGGTGHGAEEILDYIRTHGLSDRVTLMGHCEESALDELYANATALIFPSFEEGFGFPVLEAMARGLPVIAARTSSIPEIAGDAALLFDPTDYAGMSQACQRLLDDPAFAAALAAKGRAQAAKFTWQRTVEETFQVYRNTIDRQR